MEGEISAMRQKHGAIILLRSCSESNRNPVKFKITMEKLKQVH